MSEAFKARLLALTDWLKGIDTLRAIVVTLFAGAFIGGGLWANVNNRLDNNDNDIKTEQTARLADKAAIGSRVDRGFDKVLDAIKEVREQQSRAADDRTKTREDIGYIKGILKQNYDNGSGGH